MKYVLDCAWKSALASLEPITIRNHGTQWQRSSLFYASVCSFRWMCFSFTFLTSNAKWISIYLLLKCRNKNVLVQFAPSKKKNKQHTTFTPLVIPYTRVKAIQKNRTTFCPVKHLQMKISSMHRTNSVVIKRK